MRDRSWRGRRTRNGNKDVEREIAPRQKKEDDIVMQESVADNARYYCTGCDCSDSMVEIGAAIQTRHLDTEPTSIADVGKMHDPDFMVELVACL